MLVSTAKRRWDTGWQRCPTNVRGPILVTKYLVPSMIDAGQGKIINITSAATISVVSYLSPYVASKFAVTGLTKAWAAELAEFGINVNGVAPATIRPGTGQGSGMIAGVSADMGMTPEEAYETISARENVAGDKWRAECRHITDGVLFLASENADQLTGHILAVDSGTSVS